MKHRCKEMERAEIIQSPQGQAAYSYYSVWMKAYNRRIPNIETFATSQYFTSFVKFVDHVHRLQIPAPEKYINLMKSQNIQPPLWTRDECYSKYLEWIDRASDPLDQAQITVETLYKIAAPAGVHVADVFHLLHPREIIELVRLRKLSPWLLLCSTAFKSFLAKLDADDRNQLVQIVGFGYWAQKFNDNPDTVKHMKEIAAAMEI